MRVTENIPQIVSFIEQIIANGHAYATPQGNVYFDVQSIGGKYGKFSGALTNTGDEPGILYSQTFVKQQTPHLHICN
ncbi:hypothetical protein FKM82_019727 [Ascaphus truei]